ncbi:MAG: AsmA-like C-terminal region-containing protein, partial [Bacteroidales bacterium]
LMVSIGTFNYPSLPGSAKNIVVDLTVHYDGVQVDNTTVDLNKFHVELGVNPVDLTLNLKNPVTDPFTNGKLLARIDLASLSDVIPLENTKISGNINATLDWMGRVSSIEDQKFEEFKADGSVVIANLEYSSPDIPKDFVLKESSINFSPEYASISSFSAQIGSSDLQLKGNLSNYIPYILKDETVKGNLALNSTLLDINELLSDIGDEETPEPEKDTVPMEIIEVPGNIDFTFQSDIKSLKYDNLDITDFYGKIIVRDQSVIMKNLSMNMLDGSFDLSGSYNTKDVKNPEVEFRFKASGIDVPKSFAAFDMLKKVAPIAAKTTGKVSIGMNFTSLLTSEMKPALFTMVGHGSLASGQLSIKSSDAFEKVGEALNTDAFDNLSLKDVEIEFDIIDGKLLVSPFETKMGDVSMLVSGEQSFENTLDYSINLSVPGKLLGLENSSVNNLYKEAAAKGFDIPKTETINILAKVTGEMTDPKVSLDLKDNVSKTTKEIKEELIETGKQVIEEKKEEVKTEARKQAKAEADKIMKEAEKQAAQVRAEAKKAADGVRYEANANADKLLKEASNPIAKKAAEPTARKMRDEGEKKAKQIEQEADRKASNILKEARAKANKVLEQ